MELTSIYKKVASAALQNWYGKSPEEINDIINFTPNNILETHDKHGVWATDSIVAGIRAYAKGVECKEILDLSVSKLKEMVLKEDPFLTVALQKSTARKLAELKPNEEREFKQNLYVDCLEAIHDKWAVSNLKKFFDSKREPKQYMHLPLELIGWKEVINDDLFLQPVIEAAGLEPDIDDVEREYNFRSDSYVKEIFEDGIVKFLKNYYERLAATLEEYEPNEEKRKAMLEKFEEIINSFAESKVLERVSLQSKDRINMNFFMPERFGYISEATKVALASIKNTVETFIKYAAIKPDFETCIDPLREVFIKTQEQALIETIDKFEKMLKDLCKRIPNASKDELKLIKAEIEKLGIEFREILEDAEYLLKNNKELKDKCDKLMAEFEDPDHTVKEYSIVSSKIVR